MELFDWIQVGIVFGVGAAVELGLTSVRDELRGIKSELRRANERERRLRRHSGQLGRSGACKNEQEMV
jgi:hypothetical protein